MFFKSASWLAGWVAVGLGHCEQARAFALRVLVEGPSAQISVAVSAPVDYRQDNGVSVTLSPGQFFEVNRHNLGMLNLPDAALALVGGRWYPEGMRFIRLGDGVAAINLVDSESYLRGVVPREMPGSYHHEALKAQAIAARTYALTSWRRRKHGPHYDLVDTVIDQVYGGYARYDARSGKSQWLTDSRTDRAVAETHALVLDYSQVEGNYRAWGIAGWTNFGDYQLPVPKGRMLSQQVSQQMARTGWNCAQILWYWYRSGIYQLPKEV
ncbi:SpoIID/LytB domain-containing protein [Gloeobacter morelensis]|uniref:SpoIID/LytB domain-containing protein n=1 Tax=Gloeobacter morelensis MG652769 TaxID=2781736 RepID=A0ABY3PG22_9CYAN|nr:SpoIID/LytB domain-containing protein [Gloeobacter morelensis]UFP92594.1 SpoIID/LytB domain-containing protein [Gloeobacter morelensis MG652769]